MIAPPNNPYLFRLKHGRKSSIDGGMEGEIKKPLNGMDVLEPLDPLPPHPLSRSSCLPSLSISSELFGEHHTTVMKGWGMLIHEMIYRVFMVLCMTLCAIQT